MVIKQIVELQKYEVERVWRGFAFIQETKQWNDREDAKSMIIVSHARYIRVRPAGSMAGLLQQQRQQ